MNRTINFALPDGDIVAVETQDTSAPQQITRGGVGSAAGTAIRTFADAVGVIQPVASSLIGKLKEVNQGVDAVDIKFGLKFSAEAGAIIAATSTEANIEVRITWRRPVGKV